jgi:hypothetical protein
VHVAGQPYSGARKCRNRQDMFSDTLAPAAATQAAQCRVLLRGAMRPPTPAPHCMPREYFIQGLTTQGRAFRPGDWAERLAGAMASFRPDGGASGIGAFIGYSPYCVPRTVDGVKGVIVNEALKDIELMAWEFVMNFARDNHLVVVEPAAPAGR